MRGSDLWAESEAAMLSTILRNLVGNAVKYAGRGGRVVIGCRRRGGRIAIEVHDDGPGIPPERLTGIFEAFDRAGRRDGAGLGLGLHIVRQTAQAIGHPVSVQSRCGRGSVFGVIVERSATLTPKGGKSADEAVPTVRDGSSCGATGISSVDLISSYETLK